MLSTADGLGVEQIGKIVAVPRLGPGMTLTDDAVRRTLLRLEARGLAENRSGGWQLTVRGRVLWASKGSLFTL
ncbi:hypothetical protein OHB26_02400 [Nocardia sp. NBC_01503]|uniref:hypothetical protein n=1 Tax=Nocardia sp. NBC_01503 TaxID=2975997 RepID=UPI002E7C2228|nr:hypothetical protein [Nocardia sp. NBC_01503]WTL33128.1 hypothetical protein OHB26_02400 [Nocardia sp. NBC_01503]